MVKTEERTDLPDWVRQHIMMRCPYCESPIYDNSDTGVTTARKCVNPMCPGHMQYKIVELAQYFGLKGIGPATALSWCTANKPNVHLDVLKEWFQEKPSVSLGDVAVLAFIDGYGTTKATAQLNSYGSFDDYFANAIDPDPVLLKFANYLKFCERYFNVKKPLSKNKLYVMVTGTFNGFVNRDEFIRQLNDKYGQYVQIINVGKRKTGVDFLIKEEGAVDHSKSQIARDYNIPIVTPGAFKYLVAKVASQLGFIDYEAIAEQDDKIEEGGVNIEDI